MVCFQCSKHVFLFLPVFCMFLWIYIHRVCVYKWAYCCVKKNKKLPTYLPYFSVACYANTTTIFFFFFFFFFFFGPNYHYKLSLDFGVHSHQFTFIMHTNITSISFSLAIFSSRWAWRCRARHVPRAAIVVLHRLLRTQQPSGGALRTPPRPAWSSTASPILPTTTTASAWVCSQMSTAHSTIENTRRHIGKGRCSCDSFFFQS